MLTFKARLYLAALTIFLVTCSVITLIVWGVSHPRDPHFIVDEVTISNYSLSSNNHLTSTFNLLVSTFNPNSHYFLYYYGVLVSVHDDVGTLLAYSALPDLFTHRPKAHLSLKLGLVAQNVWVDDGPGPANPTTVEDLRTAGSSGGVANLEVRIRAVIRLKYKGWKKFHHMMKAVCEPIAVKFESATEASGFCQTRCYVDVS